MSLNDKATAALRRELAKCFPERAANDPGHAKLAAALSDTARHTPCIAVCTDVKTPRKHVHSIFNNPRFRVVLGNGTEDRTVEAFWRDSDNGAHAIISIDVSTLRARLAEAETYKPGATLSDPRAAIAKAEGGK